MILSLWRKKINTIKKRLDKFMVGKDAESLEKEIGDLFEDITNLKDTTDHNRKETETGRTTGGYP